MSLQLFDSIIKVEDFANLFFGRVKLISIEEGVSADTPSDFFNSPFVWKL